MKNIVLILLLLVIWSCDNKSKNKELIDEEVKLNLNSLIAKKQKECFDLRMEKANLVADSIILELMGHTIVDLQRPNKPEKPKLNYNIDSLKVEPIIPIESKQ